MSIKNINQILALLFVSLILSGCANFNQKYNRDFKHNTPLIKGDIRKQGKAEIAKTIELGPKPVSGEDKKLQKRKKISSEIKKNYLSISNEYPLLKQSVTFKYKNLEFKEAMELMGKIGEINILVGEEVAGTVSAELVNVPWDKAFQALLDMKNYAADIDTDGNLIRVHLPSTLTQQENYKSARADVIKKKFEIENSIDPINSEIFRLYYISPTEAKKTISELFSAGDSGSIQITEESTTRSIIVRGKEKDLDVVNKVLKEIDIKTQQVLIEAFIVEASSEFERALGANLGGYYGRNNEAIGGLAGTSSGSAGLTSSSAALGSSSDAITNFAVAGATSGIGVIKKTGSAVLKAEITALEKLGMVRQISNPKIFTLDNQVANVVQGTNIPYESGGETGGISFAKADLSLEVTPSIVGDGNVLLSINLKNNSAGSPVEGGIPINTMEILTKLLVADGDVVVIGGIKKEYDSNNKNQTPGVGNVPVIGNLFKGKSQKDTLNELLVFIAPRIL
ncbi:secretin N-terminal domain-containing protein [Candidatus Pelagibacter sp.]|nr:secretin N-terminal domain-containing protein [Candidatus Pelagibacter sp.]